jgi:rRNA-processing protein FCF1
MDDHVNVYPDTNIFLHFQPFDQISWEKEVGSASVCLRITAIVIDELNQKKDSHPIAHVRERAQKALSKIRKAVLTGDGRVNPSLSLVCEPALTSFDVSARGLNPSSHDDCILAAIIHYQEMHTDERTVLVTDDSGFALRAYTYKVLSAELSAKLKLPPQEDPKRKQIQELEKRIREVEKGLPRLTLTFTGGADRIEVPLQPEPVPTIEAARSYVAEQIVPRFPLQETAAWRRMMQEANQKPLPEAAAAIMTAMGSIGEMMIAKRNSDVERYFEQFAQYVLAVWKHTNDVARTVELRLQLHNSGSVPAEDVHLIFRFPKTVSIFYNGHLPPAPLPPAVPGQALFAKPKKPQSRLPALTDGIQLVRAVDVGEHYEFRYKLAKLNHHLDEDVTGLHIRFVSYEAASSFTIEYRVAAANAPDPVAGSLHVVVKKPRPGQKRLARRQPRKQ